MLKSQDKEVSKLLLENLADEKTIEAFYGQGFFDIADITDADIDELVKDKKGLLNRLKRSLHEIVKRNKPKDRPEPLPPPNLRRARYSTFQPQCCNTPTSSSRC
ncbi:MAG TPA: hypothetical protein VGH36_12385 [Acetobacteraceae bacterium]|jgi:hypothetical protein